MANNKDTVEVEISEGKLKLDVHCVGDPSGNRCRAKMALLKAFAGRMGFVLDIEREDKPNRPTDELEVTNERTRQKT